MTRIEQLVKRSGMTQKEAARVVGITQPRLNDLLKGRESTNSDSTPW